jgi:hypothetical protein
MRNKITLDQFTDEIGQITNTLEQTRTVGLGQADRLVRARGRASAREVARLRARDGAEEASTLASAAALIVSADKSAQFSRDIRAAGLLRRVSPENTIALGRVVLQRGQPRKGLNVTMVVPDGPMIAKGNVDSSGLYVLRIEREKFNRLVADAKSLSLSLNEAGGTALRRAVVPLPVRSTEILVVHFDVTGRSGKPASPTRGPAPTVPAGLRDVQGIGPARIARLRAAGITELADLAEARGADLAGVLGVSLDQAEDFVRQARTLLSR